MKNIKKLASRGDTIVEVMIVLAVLGMAISICYATANRSLTDSRQAQENSEASEIAISQIEQLRAHGGLDHSDANSPYSGASEFCYKDDDGARSNDVSGLDCKRDLYNFRVQRTGSPSDNGFTVTVSWDNVRGDGQDTVTMKYRLP
ncbi:MAG: type II secretion system protein [Candidatus Saccharimonadales bacterium]